MADVTNTFVRQTVRPAVVRRSDARGVVPVSVDTVAAGFAGMERNGEFIKRRHVGDNDANEGVYHFSA